MGNPIEITGRLLTKNWALNLLGQVLPLVVGLLTIPYVVRGLGAERFGILSIAWVLLGYFGLFDLGLGRATTKFVAECLGKDKVERLPQLVWTSVLSQAAFGLAGTALVAGAAHLLVNHLLRITPALKQEAMSSFLIMAAGMPVVLVANGLRGVLEAVQRFDLVNLVKAPTNTGVFVLPAVMVFLQVRLPGAIAMLVVLQLGAAIAYLALSLRVIPVLRRRFTFQRSLMRPLLAYGGWVTVSNTLSPLMTYLDRFVVGSVISMAAVAYYTAPYDAITRAWVVPGALTATLFPTFSSLNAAEAQTRVTELCARSVKLILLILGPGLVLVAVFARDIMRLWLGADFAAQSTTILQILAIGVLLNCLAVFPFSLIQAVGRPDLTAKLHLWELPVYAAGLILLLKQIGVAGAAVGWTLRVGFDAAALFVAASRLGYLPAASFLSGLRRAFAVLLAWAAVLLIPLLLGPPLAVRAMLAGVSLPLLAVASWTYALETNDRLFVSKMAARFGLKLSGRRAIANVGAD